MCLGNYKGFKRLICFLSLFVFFISFSVKAFAPALALFFVPTLYASVGQIIADITGIAIVSGVTYYVNSLNEEQRKSFLDKQLLNQTDLHINKAIESKGLNNASLGTYINSENPYTFTYDDLTTTKGNTTLYIRPETEVTQNTNESFIKINDDIVNVPFTTSKNNPVIIAKTPKSGSASTPITQIPYELPSYFPNEMPENIDDKTTPYPSIIFPKNLLVTKSKKLPKDQIISCDADGYQISSSKISDLAMVGYYCALVDEIGFSPTNRYRTSYFDFDGKNYVKSAYLIGLELNESIASDNKYTANENVSSALYGLPKYYTVNYDLSVLNATLNKNFCTPITDEDELPDESINSNCHDPLPLNFPESHLLNEYNPTVDPVDDYSVIYNENVRKLTSSVSVNPNYVSSGKPNNEFDYTVGTAATMSKYIDILDDRPIDKSVLVKTIQSTINDAVSNTEYDGLDPSLIASITKSENISKAIDNAGFSPTYKDLFASVTSSTATLPLSTYDRYVSVTSNDANHSNGSDTNNTIDKNGTIEIGSFAEPTLEAPQDPLGFLDNLFPHINNLSLQDRQAQCPVLQFTIFNTDVVMSSHCELLENNRKTIEIFSLLIWSFVSLRIILKA